MSKIHVLPDESLGGVLREYIEVGRIPKDNDLIINYGNNRIYKTTVFAGSPAFYDVETNEKYTGWTDINGKLHYKTLEPTDIVHIDGVRYRLVDRKAKVGEKVIVVDASLFGESYKNGDIFIVREVRHSVIFVTVDSGRYIALSHFEYNVLDPIEPAEATDDVLTVDETEASKSVIDLLANLARRVTELERKLAEIERHQNRISGRTDYYAEELGRRLEKVEEKLEMILDDIVTLDERTQPLVALVKAVRGE
jgi:hypothetical protein